LPAPRVDSGNLPPREYGIDQRLVTRIVFAVGGPFVGGMNNGLLGPVRLARGLAVGVGEDGVDARL
jgi:hypothetical protein